MSTAAAQPAGCVFILGFKTLHDMDPADIGNCVDNQAFAANGDAQQHTTKGLMAWRKSDNWTAFTNGYMTWINGPSGLVSRLNTQRCAFEGDAASYPPAACGQAAPPAAPAQPAPAPAAGGCMPSIAGAYEVYTSMPEHGTTIPGRAGIELMTLGADCSWALGGGAHGTWSTGPIRPADVTIWGGKQPEDNTEIFFSGWPGAVNGSATGPIGTSGGSPSYVWAVYDSGGPAGHVYVRYNYNSNPCGPSNSLCNGTGSDSDLAQSMMRIEAAQNGSPSL